MSQFGLRGGISIFQKCLKFKNVPKVGGGEGSTLIGTLSQIFLIFYFDASPQLIQSNAPPSQAKLQLLLLNLVVFQSSHQMPQNLLTIDVVDTTVSMCIMVAPMVESRGRCVTSLGVVGPSQTTSDGTNITKIDDLRANFTSPFRSLRLHSVRQ